MVKTNSVLTQRDAERAAAKLVERRVRMGDVPANVSPVEVLLAEVARSSAAVQWLDQLVLDLDEADVFEPGEDGLSPEAQRAQRVIALWHSERDRAVRVANIVVSAGLQEKALQIQAQQAATLANVLLAVITSDEMGLSPEQQSRARAVASARLRALDPDAA